MGWTAPGELLPELDAVLFQLNAGALSSPIQTRLGFHLLTVKERRAKASLTMTEANNTVYQQLFEHKFNVALKRWIGTLIEEAYIEIAAGLAADISLLTGIRQGLRLEMQASPLLDPANFTAGLERRFRQMLTPAASARKPKPSRSRHP